MQTQTETVKFPKDLDLNDTKAIVAYVKKRARLSLSELQSLEEHLLGCCQAEFPYAFQIFKFYQLARALPEDSPNKLIPLILKKNYGFETFATHLVQEFAGKPWFDHTSFVKQYVSQKGRMDFDKIPKYLDEHADKIDFNRVLDSIDMESKDYLCSVCSVASRLGSESVQVRTISMMVEHVDAGSILNFSKICSESDKPWPIALAMLKIRDFKTAYHFISQWSVGKDADIAPFLFARALEFARSEDLMKLYECSSNSHDSEMPNKIMIKALASDNLGVLSAFCRKQILPRYRDKFVQRIRELVAKGELAVQILTGDFDIESIFNSQMMMHPMMMHPMMFGRFRG